MPVEGEDLDDMLYAVYLAKLESLKGTKKPLIDFIKEMAESTDNFYKLTYKQFQLVTRAIHYCSAVNKISTQLLQNLEYRLNILMKNHTTEENILDLLELYKDSVKFYPLNMEQFIFMDKLYNIVRANRPELQLFFSTSNVSLFNRFPYLVYAAIYKHNPNSLLLEKFSRPIKEELAKAKTYSIELMKLIEYEDQLTNQEQHNE